MSLLLDHNPKFAAHKFSDLQRIAELGDKEALQELGLRCLNDNEIIDIDECPDCDCGDEVTCPECDHEFWVD